MIEFHETTFGEQATLQTFGSLTGHDWRWIPTSYNVGTIEPGAPMYLSARVSLSRVQRGIDYAVTNYEDLLRRLAEQVPLDKSSYLTEAEIVELHDHVIGLFGGMPGVRDPPALSSCVAQPKTAVFGQERFRSIFEKAAAYCYFIARLHPFFDGNKRTGLLAAVTFLLDNGIDPNFDDEAMYRVIIRATTGDAEPDDLAAVLRGEQDACEAGAPVVDLRR